MVKRNKSTKTADGNSGSRICRIIPDNRFRLNKKGDTAALYLILLGAFIFAITFIIYMGRMEGNLSKVGENTVKVVNTFEMSERTLFYIDASAELAAEIAARKLIEDSGYMESYFKGKQENEGCGMLAYPIIDSDIVQSSDKKIDACFPEYENEYRTVFTRNFGNMLVNYAPYEINPADFTIATSKQFGGLQIEVSAASKLVIPVYAFIESYYRDADKTLTAKQTANTIEKTDEGYFTMRAYSALTSFDRQGDAPVMIVIHDTKTAGVKETFSELQTGLHNYNYVIERNGEVYLFAPETRKTRHSNCIKGTLSTNQLNTCIIEDADRESISIALVNDINTKSHTREQINALSTLIAQISIRNKGIVIEEGSILLNSEIDSSRLGDPSQDISAQKEIILQNAIEERDAILSKRTKSSRTAAVESDNSHAVALSGNVVAEPKRENAKDAYLSEEEIMGDVPAFPDFNAAALRAETQEQDSVSVTGHATNTPIDVSEENCFNNIKTTVYYTPDASDHGNIWSTGAEPCRNSLRFCCIPRNKRGFYEEVMCQGSGVAGGQVYHYTKISEEGITRSTPLTEYTRGITSTMRDPTPKRTVAADPNCPGFDYDSKLYIYWGEDNPWNGYYIVEDTGGAFIGRCDKMDIYAGVGEKELQEALKYVGETAKVCVLDKNFQMPDLDFSGSSTFIDPKTGEYSAPYKYKVKSDGIASLFDESRRLLTGIVEECSEGLQTEKENCISTRMRSATSFGLNAGFCDADLGEKYWTTHEVLADVVFVSTEYERSYKVMGIISEIKGDSSYLQGGISAVESPTWSIITFTDESGSELKINLSGTAAEWVDYTNKDSILFESNLFLAKGSKVLMNITKVKNATHDGYYVFDFESVSINPPDILEDELTSIAKRIAECSTSKTECICTTERTRMLGEVYMNGTEMVSLARPELSFSTPFMVSQEIITDTGSQLNLAISGGKVRESTERERGAISQCVPEKKYYYICTSLKKDAGLGEIGFALKI